MARAAIAAMVAYLVVVAPAWADDKPTATGEVTSGRAGEVKALGEYTKKMLEFQRKLAAATPEERKELAKDRPDPKPYFEKADKIIDKDPADEPAFDAILFVIQNNVRADGKYYELLAKHHATRPKIGPVMTRIMASPFGRSDAGAEFAQTVITKNPSRQAKAFACYVLGNTAHQAADSDPSKLPDAEKYLARVEKEFGDVEFAKGRDGKVITFGQRVKGTLFSIRYLAIGKPVPEVKSHDLDDRETKLSSLRGKVVVMDFWATWCPPCRAMIPHSRELVEKMKDKPFVLLSISSDAQKKTLTDFLDKEKMPWSHWWEGVGESNLHSTWGVTGIPTMYVIDAKGVIRYKGVGFSKDRMEKLEKIIEDLVKEAESK
jgi:thiol-disulfide isomerase/thioredoxin